MVLYNHYANIIKLVKKPKTYLLKQSETVHNTLIIVIDRPYLFMFI